MRYKIGFEFPLFDQKFLQHAHSHFAFAGWISHTIMLLIINSISKQLTPSQIKKYVLILNANLVCAYGMLFSFSMQGYGPIAIFFSTLSIVASYAFAYLFFKDTGKGKLQFTGKNWYTFAIIINALSSAGTFLLAYMMISKNIEQNLYLASIYYYLHFQYNGWFFFACAGLFFNKISMLIPTFKEDKWVFILFSSSCVPAYFLSTLWLKLPVWLYLIVVLASIVQVVAWIRLFTNLKEYMPQLKKMTNSFIKYLILFVTLALTVKLMLQLFSTIPSISELAFGFRTIVIAYLHLVLLAIISVFLIAYMFQSNHIKQTVAIKTSAILFTIGIFLNELVLLVQGVASFSYILIPFANEALFAVAVLMFSSLLMLFLFSIKQKNSN
ncbi:MAG: hypothetical protein IPP71_20970 [Bacteroidetes bacterium]|nr:hypothetical protein [Bacteroidota bacterium]